MRMAELTHRWTIAELYRLPDDGNKYELVRGELFVTPPPTDWQETIGARLTRILDPYVAAHGLGLVYHPRAVVRIGEDTEVEPDLMVRQSTGRTERDVGRGAVTHTHCRDRVGHHASPRPGVQAHGLRRGWDSGVLDRGWRGPNDQGRASWPRRCRADGRPVVASRRTGGAARGLVG